MSAEAPVAVATAPAAIAPSVAPSTGGIAPSGAVPIMGGEIIPTPQSPIQIPKKQNEPPTLLQVEEVVKDLEQVQKQSVLDFKTVMEKKGLTNAAIYLAENTTSVDTQTRFAPQIKPEPTPHQNKITANKVTTDSTTPDLTKLFYKSGEEVTNVLGFLPQKKSSM